MRAKQIGHRRFLTFIWPPDGEGEGGVRVVAWWEEEWGGQYRRRRVRAEAKTKPFFLLSFQRRRFGVSFLSITPLVVLYFADGALAQRDLGESKILD